MRRVFALTLLVLGTICFQAAAASTDYDGKWLSEGSCSASTLPPFNPGYSFKSLTNYPITIVNGSYDHSYTEVTNGVESEDSWSGAYAARW